MGLSFRASRILDRLHKAIQTPGHQSGVHDLGARFHELRLDGKSTVTKSEFVNVTAADGLLSAEDAGVLFRGLAAGASSGGDGDSASLAEILRALRLPASRQRVALTRAVFDMIDQDRDGLLSCDEITACYRAATHPDVRRGLRAAAQVKQDFMQTLSDASVRDRGGMVSFPAFLDFYCCLTALTSEEHFRDTIVSVWVPPVSVDNDQGYALHTLGGAGGLVANLRSQILALGLHGVSTFRRGVRGAAMGGAGEVTHEAFRAAVGVAGAELTANEMTQAFRHLDRRGAGMIHVADALRAVRGEVNKRREREVDEAFDSLLFDADDHDGKDHETLDPAAVAKRFGAEEHPDVVSGVRTQREVLSEFLEAFDGGGEIGGRVTRTEWHEHHADMSALIVDDEAFCSYLQNVWGLSRGKGFANDERNNGKQVDVKSGPHRVMERSRPPVSTTSNRRRIGEEDTMDDHISSSGSSDTEARQAVAHHPRDLSPRFIPRLARAPFPSSNADTADIIGRANVRGVPENSIPAGVSALLERARGSLAVGGVRDAFRLLKGFREEDQRGDGKVSLAGLKAAVGGAGFGLNEAETRIIFQHFDQRGDGEVSYESFLRSIRETLPTRRLVLVHQAFDRVDSDGDGVAFVGDIARAFNASAHPEVLEGSREEQDIRREFLDSFAVSDGGRSRCTRDDFIGWMELVSSSLPTSVADDRFESLVRGCWGIPKGADGNVNGRWADATGEEESGNRGQVRVVVTHADGSVSLAAVCMEPEAAHATDDNTGSNTGVISEAQAERIRQELLETRGIHAVHVRLLDKQLGHAGRSDRGDGPTHLSDRIDSNKSCSVGSGSRHQPSAEEMRIARLGSSGDGPGARGSSGGYGAYGGGSASLGLDHGLLSVLEVARKHLVLRGPAGFFSLSERLYSKGYARSPRPDIIDGIHDHSKNNGPFLSLGGFKEALLEIGCGLTSKDLTSVFMHLDKGGRGEVPVDVALDALRGRLGGARLSLVRAAFSRLRGGGNAPAEAAAAADVSTHFDPKVHPEVIAGRRSPEDVRNEFMDHMTTTNGVVTKKDFETYYTNVSAATPSDDYFSLQVKSCWGLGTAATASASNATTSDGAAPHSAAAGEATPRLNADYDPTLTRRTYSKARTSAPPGVLPGTTENGNAMAVAIAMRDESGKFGRGGGGRVPTPGVWAVLRKLGVEAKAQGAAWGLAGLRRALYDADRNTDGFLSLREFKAALSHSGAGLTAAEIRALFTHLETWGGARRAGGGGGDGNGVAPWKALLDAVRPPLCGQRLQLVHLAFATMDTRDEGIVSPETVSQRFDASRHPSVLRGHATAEEVRKELLDTFFAGAAPGGRVSKEDFVEHHANLSFGVPSDAQFGQLITNCWGLDDPNAADHDRLSQADGITTIGAIASGLAGSSNLRKFLVSYADGSQSVEELSFSSEGREKGERETPLSTAEERAVKRVLLKRDNIHATQVRLLPQPYPETKTLPRERLNVDRRPAWAWAPMSLAEVHAARAAAANPDIPADEDKVNAKGEVHFSSKRGETDEGGAALEGMGDVEWEETGWQGGGGDDGGGAGASARQRMRAGGKRTQAGEGREADLSVRYLMAKVRAELNTRGVAGVENHVTRRLRESAVAYGGKDCHIGVREVDFRNAIREAGVPLTESDTRRIFEHFEMGSSGVMNHDALLNCLAGRMNNARRMLVDEAFDRLDTGGTGCLAFGQVIDAFDPTRHPEVVSGCRSPEVLLREVVTDFAAGLPDDPRDEATITKEDFRRYYDDVSCAVPDDGSFELLLKVSWRIPTPETAHSASVSDTGGRKPVTPVMETSSSCGAGRRHFSPENSAAKSLARGNDHYSAVPLHVTTNEGRESSFETLREGRAAGSGLGGRNTPAPSEENRRLRAALLSRTFDSQISFGVMDEAPEECRAPSVGEISSRPPAGSGRVGRVAEGAAWIPGGRRLIPGSKAFTSHMNNGMRVTRDKAGRLIEQGWRPRNSSGIDNHEAVVGLEGDRLGSALARRSQAAAETRQAPVWIPQDLRSNRTAAAEMGNHDARERRGSTSPFEPVSLAQLAGTDLKREARGGQDDDRRVLGDAATSLRRDGSVPPTVAEAPTYRINCATTDQPVRHEFEEERSSVCSGHEMAGRAVDGRGGHGGQFDWWGGSVPFTGRARIGGAGGGSSRSKNVSDTYKSSLIFG